MHMHDPFAHCLARFFRFLFLTVWVHRLREAQRCLKDLLKTSWQNPSSQSHTQLVQDRGWKTWFVAVFQMVSVLSQEPHCPGLKGINSVWHLGSSTVCFLELLFVLVHARPHTYALRMYDSQCQIWQQRDPLYFEQRHQTVDRHKAYSLTRRLIGIRQNSVGILGLSQPARGWQALTPKLCSYASMQTPSKTLSSSDTFHPCGKINSTTNSLLKSNINKI